jgi:hypothetical protein
MPVRSYRVILDGVILEGFDRDRVIEKLAGAFKKDDRVIERLLQACPRPIRGGLDLAAARKYQAVLSKIGAASHIEAEEEEKPAPGPEPVAEARLSAPEETHQAPAPQPELQEAPQTSQPLHSLQQQAESAPESREETTESRLTAVVCPKCGYTPISASDVLLVRGDCPRCGLRVTKDLDLDADESQEAAYRRRKFRPEVIYRDRTPASWDRRSAASLHTFGLFLAVHATLVLLWIFLFVPVDAIPTHAGTLFLQAALWDWPEVLVSGAIILVSFVLPIFNRGLSWGQRMADIEVLYTEETRMGGFYLSLTLRAVVAIAVSFTPGWMLLWLGSWLGWFSGAWATAAVMILGGAFGWIAAWAYTYTRADSRSLVDLAAGTVQVEDVPMPPDAFRKALVPILAVAGCWILLTGIIPLAMKLAR